MKQWFKLKASGKSDPRKRRNRGGKALTTAWGEGLSREGRIHTEHDRLPNRGDKTGRPKRHFCIS